MINITSDRHVNTGGRQAIVKHSLASSLRNIFLSNLIELYFLYLTLWSIEGKWLKLAKDGNCSLAALAGKEITNVLIKCQFHASPMLSALTIVMLPNSHKNHMQQN